MSGRRIRQRRRPDVAPPPLRLARFRRDEWPDGTDEHAVLLWAGARENWCTANNCHEAGPLGTPLDRLRERRETRLAVIRARRRLS